MPPLLTIAIPTFNRGTYLELCVEQLEKGLPPHAAEIEIIISDNCSTDETDEIVKKAMNRGISIHYIRNAANIGSDKNIAQCFNEAKGKYVWILGDDDLMLDETLALLMGELRKGLYGLICMRSYGYDKDFRLEYPGNHGRLQVFTSTSKFLAAIGQRITFLSACVINKSLLSDVNALPYIDTNLVQVNLAILATVRSKENLFINRYLVAGKRNNSGGYNFYKVFVSNLYKCLESQAVNGLTHAALSAFKRKMLVSFYPYYLLIDRLGSSFRRMEVFKAFSVHYGKDLVFYLTVAPIILLPAPLAVVWGVGATLIGRVMDGDFRRGLFFIKNHLICSKQ